MFFTFLRHVLKVLLIKTYAMKKLFTLAIVICFVSGLYGQKSIDELFSKYSGQDGFTTVTISGNLLELLRCRDHDNDDDDFFPEKITEIRILAQNNEDHEYQNIDNFYNAVMKDINLKDFDEFMRVKGSNNDMRMLVRSEGRRFKEFLLISGGESNAVIQVKGDLSYADARKMSDNIKKKHSVEIYSDIN
jgi:hypothetical protein